MARGAGGETRYYFADGLMKEEANKFDEAELLYTKVPPADPSYLDAQSRLLQLAQRKVAELAKNKAPATEQIAAAGDLLKRCAKYLDLVQKRRRSSGHASPRM